MNKSSMRNVFQEKITKRKNRNKTKQSSNKKINTKNHLMQSFHFIDYVKEVDLQRNKDAKN